MGQEKGNWGKTEKCGLFEVLSLHLAVQAEKNHERPKSGCPVSGTRFGREISQK
jgi:hypothetical protein